jgi:hypothetical protein
MSSLRRDLFERKLWPAVVLLLAAIVAVPLVLLNGAPAAGSPTVPPPPAAVPSQTTTHVEAPVPAKVLIARIPRNPFAGGMPTLSAKPAPKTTTPGSSSTAPAASSSTATSPASSSASTSVSMVSPSPATSSPASTATTGAGSSASSTAATPSHTPTSTIASAAPSTKAVKPAQVQSWTTYSVSVRFGKDLKAPVKTDIARLMPLPNARQPQVMFMGVMAGGSEAVFALHAGIGHTGPGLCRPDHLRCSAILLKAGQTEHLTVSDANGAHKQLILRVVRVSSSVTHSRKVALAAYQRHSAVGLCELELADPVSYSATTGTISSVAKAACQNQPAAIAFSYIVAAP